jgi:hypothetical protein
MALGITLESFKNESMAQVSVSKYTADPQLNSWKDGGFLGECVSEVNQYCWRVLNVPAGSWGHAVDWWTNSNVLEYFDQVKDGSRQDGDILVWGDDKGSWTGQYGHIAISYKGKLLNQNWGNSRKVSINDFFSDGYLGALRLKGVTVKPTNQQVDETISLLHQVAFGKPASDAVFKDWRGVLNNNYVEGVISILKGCDKNPGALKNKPPVSVEYTVLAEVNGKPTLLTPKA